MAIKIGEVLISRNLVSPHQVDKALAYQKKHGGKLGSILVELGFVSDHDLAKALSEQLHLPAAQYDEFRWIPQTAIEAMPQAVAKNHQCVPLLMRDRLRVAISDPWEIKNINEWGLRVGKQLQLVIAPQIWITAALEQFYQIPREDRYRGTSTETEILPAADVEVVEESTEPGEGPLTFPAFQQKLSESRSIQGIFDGLLEYLSPLFPQVAVFVAKKGMFCGWIVQGFPVRARDFAKIEIPTSTQTPLQEVAREKKPYRGPISAEIAKRLGFSLIQVPFGQEVRFYPILFRGAVMTVLMAVASGGNQAFSEAGEKEIIRATEKVEAALEMLVYRKLILAPTTV